MVMWHLEHFVIKRIVAITLAISIAGCEFATYRDVSSRVENAALIGQEYRTHEEVLIHAVTMDPNYRKVTDIYTLTPKPGFAGREVVFQRPLPAGSLLRVVRVEECTNWWCYRTQLIVELPGMAFGDHPISVSETFGGHDIFKLEKGQRVISTPLLEPIRKS
jgi:hypothetical protein